MNITEWLIRSGVGPADPIASYTRKNAGGCGNDGTGGREERAERQNERKSARPEFPFAHERIVIGHQD